MTDILLFLTQALFAIFCLGALILFGAMTLYHATKEAIKSLVHNVYGIEAKICWIFIGIPFCLFLVSLCLLGAYSLIIYALEQINLYQSNLWSIYND